MMKASRRSRASHVIVATAALTASIGSAIAQPALRPADLKPSSTSPEAGLWTISDKAEIDARQSAEINRDPALNAYVKSVACRAAENYCGAMRIYLMDRPFVNASMAPNGYMEVWSGLLLRAKNEDELAFVLGHEIGHFAYSHSWQAFQDQKARADGAMVASFLISAVGVVAAVNAGTAAGVQNISNATQGLVNAVYLGAVAGMFGFSRANETEADAYGFKAIATSSDYDPAAAAAIWRRLKLETAASDFKRVRESDTRASIFDSHPLVSERIDALDRLASGAPSHTSVSQQRYREAIRPHISAWLRDDLRRRDFGQSLFVIDQLAANGEDLGVLNYYRGEAIRLRRSADYQAESEAAYREAISHADAPALAYRELADLAEKRGEKNEMADLLIAYLLRAPNAKDAAFAKMRIEQIKPFPVQETPPVPAHVEPDPAPILSDMPAAASPEPAPAEAEKPAKPAVKPAPPAPPSSVAMSLADPS